MRLMILIVLIFSISSFAIQKPTPADKFIADTLETQKGLKRTKEILQRRISILSDWMDKAVSRQSNAKAAWEESMGGFMGFFQGPGDKQLKADYEAAKNKMKSAEKDREELKFYLERLAQINASLDRQNSEISRLQKGRRLEIQNLKRQVENNSLMYEFSKLQTELIHVDEKFDIIEDIYDKKMIGAYVQDKIGQLLNSQVICAARKRCMSADPTSIPAKTIQKELFPSTSSRSEYDKKVNAR